MAILKDYKKLFLVFDVGAKDMPTERVVQMIERMKIMLREELDDTVKFFVFPNYESRKIEVKSLITQKISEKQLKKLIDTTEQWYLKIKQLNEEKLEIIRLNEEK